jgi:DNA repair protein RadC
MSLKDLPADARPREKLLARGAGALSDAELLALLLRTGTAGRGVLQMAQELLDDFGGMAGLLHAGADDLKRIKGLGGSAKRAELIAVLELARRALAEQLKEKPALDSPAPSNSTCSCTWDNAPTRCSPPCSWTPSTGCLRWRNCFAAR